MNKKLHFNTLAILAYQIINIIIGLILPRLFLMRYGSDINGLISSITQLLGVISLLDLGVGAIVQSSLYKPLYEKDIQKISEIYVVAQRYFRLIAKILIVYIIGVGIYLGFIKNTGFSPMYTILLVFAISISSFAQYYFGICNSFLIESDQKLYITYGVSTVTIIINAILTVVLLNMGASIQIVKLVSSIIFLIKPLIYTLYVKKNYQIFDLKNVPSNALPNKWSGLIQHITSVVTGSTGYVILTILASMKIVSIYNIYLLPLTSINSMITGMSSSYKSYYGNLLAKGNLKKLQEEFEKYEVMIHCVILIIFGCIAKVLVPFVLLYTNGVHDANYERWIFSYLITLSYALFTLRTPYTTIIFAAGKFKETQAYCLIEIFLNVVVSILGTIKFGMIGVAIGGVIGSGYRSIISAWYLKNNILNRSYTIFWKKITLDIIVVGMIVFFTNYIKFNELNVLSWIIYSFEIFTICLVVTLIVYGVFYYKSIKNVLRLRGK